MNQIQRKICFLSLCYFSIFIMGCGKEIKTHEGKSMTVERLVVGSLGANCYLLGNEKKVIVIDPGDEANVIKQHIRNREVEAILLTHTHIDHIFALNQMKQFYPAAKVGVHYDEVKYLSDSSLNLSVYLGERFIYSQAPELILKEGMEIPFLNYKIKVIHTPGHTPGGVSFLVDNYLFSGDTLFKLSIGRTDFPGGSYSNLIESIKNKLFLLPDDTKVFPGHMEETTIGFEKKNNPFLN